MASEARAAPVGAGKYFYPLWLRLWHWSNAALFVALVASGVSLHYASIDAPLLPFGAARAIHNVCGLLLTLLYLLYLVGNLLSSNGRFYVPNADDGPSGMWRQARFYLGGVFQGEAHPFHRNASRKFNPLQKLTYLGVMFGMMPLLVATGLFLLFPQLAPERVMGAGGVWPMAVAHSVAAYLLTLFLVSHVYLTTTGETPLGEIREMLTGWHRRDAASAGDGVLPLSAAREQEDPGPPEPPMESGMEEISHENQTR